MAGKDDPRGTMALECDYIVEELRGLAVPCDELNLDPENTREHGPKNLRAIKASLQRFGQRLPIVVQKTGNIVRAGNGRLIAARELGWTHIAAVVTDDDDMMAAAFAIADNRTADLADWNESALAAVLANLQAQEFDGLDALGYSDKELTELAMRAAADTADLEGFEKPTLDAESAGGTEKPNRSWFYVEYYSDDDMFATLQKALKAEEGMRTEHELKPEVFVDMVRAWQTWKESLDE